MAGDSSSGYSHLAICQYGGTIRDMETALGDDDEPCRVMELANARLAPGGR
jgi:hypothetical protein